MVLCLHVVEHVEDLGFLGRLASLLGEGGRLVVEVPHETGHRFVALDGNTEHLYGFTLHAAVTLAGLAGLPVPATVQGSTLQPLLADPARSGKLAVFSTMQAPRGAPAGGAAAEPLEDFAGVTASGGANAVLGYSIRTSRHRYIEWDAGRAGRQLYDLEQDPRELRNLAADPAHVALQADLRRQLHDHLRRVAVQ